MPPFFSIPAQNASTNQRFFSTLLDTDASITPRMSPTRTPLVEIPHGGSSDGSRLMTNADLKPAEGDRGDHPGGGGPGREHQLVAKNQADVLVTVTRVTWAFAVRRGENHARIGSSPASCRHVVGTARMQPHEHQRRK